MAYDPNAEEEELAYDSHIPLVQHVFSDVDTHIPRLDDLPEDRAEVTRPMSAGMRAKYPGVVSALFQMQDGRQVRFVR